jgi:hypothetical protein
LYVSVYAPPLIVTLVIALPLDQVLQVVATHLAVQYSFDLILFLIVNESWGWGGVVVGQGWDQDTPGPTQPWGGLGGVSGIGVAE